MGWAWYLSNDMMLFLVSLVPIYVYAKINQLVGKTMVFGLIATFQAIGMRITFQNEFVQFYWMMLNPS
jgi:hypothetical protein